MARIDMQERIASAKIEIEFNASTHTFDQFYQAQTFVEHVIDERKYKWKDKHTIQLGKLTIHSDDLKEIIDYEPTRRQREWELSPFLLTAAMRLRTSTPSDSPVHLYWLWHKGDDALDKVVCAVSLCGKKGLSVDAEEVTTILKECTCAKCKVLASKPNNIVSDGVMKKERIVEKTLNIKPSKDGTTIAELAKRIGIEPSKARAILRRNNIGKPYAWDDTAPIEKILRSAK